MYPNLKLQLWKSGIRQNRLAKMLEMDESALSRIVNGFREPTQELRCSIAGLLHCDPEWLFQQPEEQREQAAQDEMSIPVDPTSKSAALGKA
jgi:transcriptional regulator with XRE-family HTH domain